MIVYIDDDFKCHADPADADVLVSELETVRDKLPKEAKDALDKHIKKKNGKK